MDPNSTERPPDLVETAGSEHLGKASDKKAQNIMFVSAEVAPYSKAGGLAQVLAGQPKALAELGKEVSVVSPWYAFNNKSDYHVKVMGTAQVPFNGGMETINIFERPSEYDENGVKQIFIQHPYFDLQDGKVYLDDNDIKETHVSNEERFAFLSRASLVAADVCDIKPDLVHAHDWHTAYVPTIMKYSDPELLPEHFKNHDIPTVLSIHNAGSPAFQGIEGLEHAIHQLRLPHDIASKTHFEFNGQANALWSGIGNADKVIPVSPNYANEICNPTQAEYDEGALPLNQFNNSTFGTNKIVGITNGIDTKRWDPETNEKLTANFSKDDISGKQTCKVALCEKEGLDSSRPLLSCVGRAEDQKGLDVLAASIDGLVEQGWNVIVGGEGQPEIKQLLAKAAEKHPENVKFHAGYADSNTIFAGSDAMIVPSRYEPCGLTQMEAMHYGTIPLVADTGGLTDTIDDGATGFKFTAPEKSLDEDSIANASTSLLAGTQHAINTYNNNHDKWQEMQKSAMSVDNSWEHAAGEYIKEYDKLVNEKTQNVGRDING